MRDKKRIERILKLIGKLWKKFPDQRLGQLLDNYVFHGGREGGDFAAIRMIEDDIVERRVRAELYDDKKLSNSDDEFWKTLSVGALRLCRELMERPKWNHELPIEDLDQAFLEIKNKEILISKIDTKYSSVYFYDDDRDIAEDMAKNVNG